MSHACGSSDNANQTRGGLSTFSITGIVAVFGVLTPILLAVGAGYYSAVRQCNQDASDINTQLTSVLLEIGDREERMKSMLAADNVSADSLAPELVDIENGAEGHYGDPTFKDHTLSSLVNQYNRLLRRVRFNPDQPSDDAVLDIDTKDTHPAIATLKITKKDAHAFAHNIDQDLTQFEKQQTWHTAYGPVRLCSVYKLASGSEPWHLIGLVKRPPATHATTPQQR